MTLSKRTATKLTGVFLVLCAAVSLVAGEDALVSHPRNIHGNGSVRLVVDAEGRLLKGFTFDTPHGAIVVGIERNGSGELARVAVTHPDTGERFASELGIDPASGLLTIVTDFGRYGQFRYDIDAERAVPVEVFDSSIPDCDALQDSPLFRAVVEAHATAGDLLYSGRAAPARREAVGAGMLVLSLLGPSVAHAAQCEIGPARPFYSALDPCWMISPGPEQCEECCDRNKLSIQVSGAIPVATASALGPVVGGGAAGLVLAAAGADYKACVRACEVVFPLEPPGEGGVCGSLTFTGTCRAECRKTEGRCMASGCADGLRCCCDGWNDPIGPGQP